ncbi:BTB/POZ domain-containing protein 6-like isoform X2 [Rhodnius prolixus]
MFYGSMCSHGDLSPPILIPDIEYDTFKQMISYLYGEQPGLICCSNACDLYGASKKYMIQNLTKKCLSYLYEHISPQKVLSLYEFAKFHCEDWLEKLCLKVIQMNTSVVIKSSSFLDACESTLNVILDMKRLNISSELELVLAVERWAVAQVDRKGYSTPRNAASLLVPRLRFLTLTVNEFITGLMNSKLLNESEKLEILLRIIRPQLPPMGNLLCEKNVKRKEYKDRCLATLNIKEVLEARCDGTEWLTSIFTTDSKIDILGVELHLQINDTDIYYKENLMVKVSLANEPEHFADGTLQNMVRYNSKAEIMFKEVATLEPFQEYAIHIFLCSVGVYPLGRESNVTCENQNVNIDFLSHSSWERSQPYDMTVLNAIIFSDPLD